MWHHSSLRTKHDLLCHSFYLFNLFYSIIYSIYFIFAILKWYLYDTQFNYIFFSEKNLSFWIHKIMSHSKLNLVILLCLVLDIVLMVKTHIFKQWMRRRWNGLSIISDVISFFTKYRYVEAQEIILSLWMSGVISFRYLFEHLFSNLMFPHA